MSGLTMQEVIEHCEKTAKRIEDNVGFCREWLKQEPRPLESKNYLEHKQTAEWLKELQRYKELEEAGRLITLPCNVGDTVYDVVLYVDGKYRIKEMVAKAVRPYGAIRWFKEKAPELWNVYLDSDHEYAYRHFYDFGRTAFLTKAEAEVKLAELQRGE